MSKECSAISSSPSMPPNQISNLSPLFQQQPLCCGNSITATPSYHNTVAGMDKTLSFDNLYPTEVRISTPNPQQTAEYISGGQQLQQQKQQHICAGCGFIIWERTLLNAVDRNWHSHCLKCYCCGGRLADLGSSFFLRSNMLLCRQDYLKLFGIPGTCNGCQSSIPPDEMVMRCQAMVYHLKCFNCAHCHAPLLPGDRFLLLNGSLFCEHEFARLLPAGLTSFSGGTSGGPSSQLPGDRSFANGSSPCSSTKLLPSPLHPQASPPRAGLIPMGAQLIDSPPPAGHHRPEVNGHRSPAFPTSNQAGMQTLAPSTTPPIGTVRETNASRARQKKVDARRCPLQVC